MPFYLDPPHLIYQSLFLFEKLVNLHFNGLQKAQKSIIITKNGTNYAAENAQCNGRCFNDNGLHRTYRHEYPIPDSYGTMRVRNGVPISLRFQSL